jgi:hypothetical protein
MTVTFTRHDMQTDGWNPAALSREFLLKAENAERYLMKLRTKLDCGEFYKTMYDETLADLYVYNYLHGRTFLKTKNSLLAALREFIVIDGLRPYDVFDFELFLMFRKNNVKCLIDRFKRDRKTKLERHDRMHPAVRPQRLCVC